MTESSLLELLDLRGVWQEERDKIKGNVVRCFFIVYLGF